MRIPRQRRPPAVDALCVPLISLTPYSVAYLMRGSGSPKPSHEWNITQRGESLQAMRPRLDSGDAAHLRRVAGV